MYFFNNIIKVTFNIMKLIMGFTLESINQETTMTRKTIFEKYDYIIPKPTI